MRKVAPAVSDILRHICHYQQQPATVLSVNTSNKQELQRLNMTTTTTHHHHHHCRRRRHHHLRRRRRYYRC